MHVDNGRKKNRSSTSQVLVTWQWLMCAHVTDGCDKSMQTMAIPLCVELG